MFAIDMDGGLKVFLVLLAGAAVGGFFGVTAKLPEGQKSDSAAASCTSVQLMLDGGWMIIDT